MRRIAALIVVLGGAATAAPATGPGGLPPLPADAPPYGDAEFLADSMATVELVVIGTPGKDELRITRVVAGRPAPALIVRADVVRIVGPRFAPQPGLWLLVRSPDGYYAVNPDAAPLPETAWKSLAPMLPAVPGKDVAVELHPDRVSIALGEHMSETLTRQFDTAGRLLIVHRAPKRGRGLWLELRDGRLQEFSSTLDGKLDGLDRDYDDQGRPESEDTWRAGVRNGPERAWKDGVLVRDVVYDDGLARPIMRWKGTPGSVVVEKHERSNLYKAPARLRDRIKVGMSAADVLAILRVDFSLSDGIDFDYDCALDLHVGFAKGRVSEIVEKDNGNICDP